MKVTCDGDLLMARTRLTGVFFLLKCQKQKSALAEPPEGSGPLNHRMSDALRPRDHVFYGVLSNYVPAKVLWGPSLTVSGIIVVFIAPGGNGAERRWRLWPRVAALSAETPPGRARGLGLRCSGARSLPSRATPRRRHPAFPAQCACVAHKLPRPSPLSVPASRGRGAGLAP